jgi:hypothetical protein
MTLKEQTQKTLQGWTLFSTGTRSLDLVDGGLRLACELTALETLGCAFSRFAISSNKLAGASIEQLKKTSEALSKRLTYLLEPIRPIEVDAEHCVVQLRSQPPQKDEDSTSYYELLVKRTGELSLCRYVHNRDAQASGALREAVPAHVTREVFLRLIGDFCAVAE